MLPVLGYVMWHVCDQACTAADKAAVKDPEPNPPWRGPGGRRAGQLAQTEQEEEGRAAFGRAGGEHRPPKRWDFVVSKHR